MHNYTEYVGYIASAFVLLSFVMKRMLLLRVINVIGCSFFIWYGVMLESWPIVITNVAIVLVNTWFIIQLTRAKKTA